MGVILRHLGGGMKGLLVESERRVEGAGLS